MRQVLAYDDRICQMALSRALVADSVRCNAANLGVIPTSLSQGVQFVPDVKRTVIPVDNVIPLPMPNVKPPTLSGWKPKTRNVATVLTRASRQFVFNLSAVIYDWLIREDEISAYSRNYNVSYKPGAQPQDYIFSGAVDFIEYDTGILNFQSDVPSGNSAKNLKWVLFPRMMLAADYPINLSDQGVVNNMFVQAIHGECVDIFQQGNAVLIEMITEGTIAQPYTTGGASPQNVNNAFNMFPNEIHLGVGNMLIFTFEPFTIADWDTASYTINAGQVFAWVRLSGIFTPIKMIVSPT